MDGTSHFYRYGTECPKIDLFSWHEDMCPAFTLPASGYCIRFEGVGPQVTELEENTIGGLLSKRCCDNTGDSSTS